MRTYRMDRGPDCQVWEGDSPEALKTAVTTLPKGPEGGKHE